KTTVGNRLRIAHMHWFYSRLTIHSQAQGTTDELTRLEFYDQRSERKGLVFNCGVTHRMRLSNFEFRWIKEAYRIRLLASKCPLSQTCTSSTARVIVYRSLYPQFNHIDYSSRDLLHVKEKI